MKREDIKKLYKLYRQFESEVEYVFDKLDSNDLLDFYNNRIENIDIDEGIENTICVTYYDYGYDLYDCSSVEFPTDILGDSNKVSEYIEKLKEEKESRKKLEMERKQKLELENRRKLYNELKQEFE